MTTEGRPAVLPLGWTEEPYGDGWRFVTAGGLFSVITSVREAGGKRWLHVSCAHAEYLPSWKELRWIKDLWIGRERKAIQVIPSEAEHASLHPYCLHLFHCLDGDPLPDFRVAGLL